MIHNFKYLFFYAEGCSGALGDTRQHVVMQNRTDADYSEYKNRQVIH